MKNFVDRVIEELEVGLYMPHTYNYKPIDGFGAFSIYSVDFNEDQEWFINARYDSLTYAFPITTLTRRGLDLDLTKEERKRLRVAANAAIKQTTLNWQERRQRLKDSF